METPLNIWAAITFFPYIIHKLSINAYVIPLRLSRRMLKFHGRHAPQSLGVFARRSRLSYYTRDFEVEEASARRVTVTRDFERHGEVPL